jgi:hypothetical protein
LIKKYIYCLLLITSCAREKGKPLASINFDQVGYTGDNVFIYSVTLKDHNDLVLKRDTLGLFINDKTVPKNNWNKLMSWQFVRKTDSTHYDYIEERHDNSVTGIVITDTTLMIHPPRFSYLKNLQHCPYPFFHKPDSIGRTWHWEFLIGRNWATSVYPIKDTETFHVNYCFADTLTLSTKFGNLLCSKITANSTSSFGTSTATYYLNEEYGIVRFAVRDVQLTQYEFELTEKKKEEQILNPGSARTLFRRKEKLKHFNKEWKIS